MGASRSASWHRAQDAWFGYKHSFSRGPTIRFSAFVAVYQLRRASKWKPSTARSLASYAQATLIPTFGSTRLADIRAADVATWFYTYSRTSPGGANSALWLMKNMLAAASEWGYILGPRLVVRLKKNRRPPVGHVLSDNELRRLGDALADLAALKPSDADAIRLILLTGCRPSEVRRLDWAEVKPDRLELADGKTGGRVVHLGMGAREVLESRRSPDAHGPVFPSKLDRARCTSTLLKSWTRVKAAAGLPKAVRLHDLRHTFTSHSMMSGETLLTTGGLLGHRRTESTVRYAHLSDDYLSAAVGLIASQIETWMALHVHPARSCSHWSSARRLQDSETVHA